MAESLQLSPYDQSFPPIISKRSPTTRDKAELGTIWINTVLNDAFILTSVASGVATWINAGGGSGTFSSLSISGASVLTGAVTASTLGLGVVFSSAVGLLSSSNGTNGQLIIGNTAGAPAWSTPTSSDGSLIVSLGAHTLDLKVSGATVSSFPTDAGTANPVLGATTIAGGSNIGTSAAGGTVTVALVGSPSVAGSLTAGASLNMSAGTCTITSDTNADKAIYLHVNAGVAETINIYSQQGTGVDSVNIHSLAGGITVAGGKAAATAINLTASNAAGGITLTAGTNGVTNTITNGAFTVTTGTGAINIGTDAVAKIVTIGSTTGGAGTVIQSGTGDVVLTSTDKITLDSTNNMDLNSSAGNINIATNAVANTVTIGNASGATSVVVNGGTGAMQFGANAIAHATTVGSVTGAAETTVQGGTGGIAINAAGIVTMLPATDTQAASTVTINANVGVGTFTGLTTAAAATATLTVTNSLVTATSAILCTLAVVGAEDAQMTVQKVRPLAGSFVVKAKNNGTDALASNLILTFWIIKAS